MTTLSTELSTQAAGLAERGCEMKLKLQSVLLGTAISAGLTLFMWASKMMAVLIWITLPGWLFALGDNHRIAR
jgi:hypothetical protein